LVHSVLLETGLAASRLELEITEGVLVDDFAHVPILRSLSSSLVFSAAAMPTIAAGVLFAYYDSRAP
jgi:hypothetical protein